MNKIDEKLKKLAKQRKLVADLKENVDTLWAMVVDSDMYKLWEKTKEDLKSASETLELMDEDSHAEAVLAWNESDKTSKQFNGFSIGIWKRVTVLDEKKAKVWAATNAPNTLTLNKKFDKAVENLELDFVKVEDDPRASIASDLSKFLVEPEKENKTDDPIPF